MYDPRHPSLGQPFPELDDPAFWQEIASQVDTTTLLYPDTPGPIPPYRITESLRLPAPKTTTALIPNPSTTKLTCPETSGSAEQPPDNTKKQNGLLLPVGLIVLACMVIFAAFGTLQSQKSSKPAVQSVQSGTDYQAMARADAEASGIPTDLFVRQINQESGFDPKAVSPAGAQGIAQFMPATAKGLGIDPWNPVQALKAAAKLMAAYYKSYGSYQMALAAYNCGPQCLANARKLGGSSWGCYLPSETSAYIYAIMNVKVC
jgi:hypothetical protein